MIAYNALLKNNNYGQVKEFLMIKESSFSCSVFLFGIFWFLYQKMWQESLFYSLNIFLIIVISKLLQLDSNYLFVLFHVMASFNANNWKCNHLQTKLKYSYVGLFFAKTEFEALQMALKTENDKYFDYSFIDSAKNFQKSKFFKKK